MNVQLNKFDIARDKGGKALNSIVERRYKSTNEAQISHNLYVTGIAMYNRHQTDAYDKALKDLLNGLQTVQTHHVRDFQGAVQQFLELCDLTQQDYKAVNATVMKEIGLLDGAKEYELFLKDFDEPSVIIHFHTYFGPLRMVVGHSSTFPAACL